jgi:flagellar hook-length control protein FliK
LLLPVALQAAPAEIKQERGLAEQPVVPQLLRENAAAAAVTLPSAPVAAAQTAPAPNVGAAIAAQVLDLAKSGEWINELARDIARTASSDGTMRFRLAPETLGELRVEIMPGERGALVKLHVTSEAAQQALAEASAKLVQEARAQGVRIAEAEVSLSGGQSQSRDPSRQASSDQPMRSFRSAPDHHSTTGDRSQPARRGRTDLYA